jgi:C-terminal processing protease CtpA/Prc
MEDDMKKRTYISLPALTACLMIIFTSADLSALVETGGIGVKVAQLYDHRQGETDHRGSIVVLDVIKGSAAEKAGLEKGDVILKIDDITVKNHDFLDVLENHLRSPSYTEVTLLIWRSSIMEKLIFRIMREPTVY